MSEFPNLRHVDIVLDKAFILPKERILREYRRSDGMEISYLRKRSDELMEVPDELLAITAASIGSGV